MIDSDIILENDHLTVSIESPGTPDTYCGRRFSWAGNIRQLTWKDQLIFGPWSTEEKSLDAHDNVAGTAGEFGMGSSGMPTPLGYAEAKVGEGFLKMGVGVLRRSKEIPYGFFDEYDLIETFPWTTEKTDNSVSFSQKAQFNDYAYDYSYSFEIGEDSFVTKHSIENTGTKDIVQTHYSHNFLTLANELIGPDCQIEFPFVPGLGGALPDYLELNDKTLKFRKDLRDTAFYSELSGFGTGIDDNAFTVRNTKSGIEISAKGDCLLERFHIFATPDCICPEPFVKIDIAPGQSFNWQHSYELKQI